MTMGDMSAVLDQLADTPRFAREAFDSAPLDAWDSQVQGVQFSMRQEMCHLRDVELEGHLVRVMRMAAERQPLLTDLDGTQMANERAYEMQDPVAALRDFTALRALTVARLRQLPPDAWSRTGMFSPDAAFDIRELTAMIRHHDEEHCDEISTLLAALR